MKQIPHRAIAASAGSGKTFQLAHRYIELMACGVKPDRIIALTFSRKAAGEIFDSIVGYLCDASRDEKAARTTAGRIAVPDLNRPRFQSLLRELVAHLHRLHVATLDSFTVGIIRTFPMELGLSSEFRVMDSAGAEAKALRQEVLGRIFGHGYVTSAQQLAFLEAFKQATFGQEEKGLERALERFIGEYRTHYQVLPRSEAWGASDVIWPGGNTWLDSEVDAQRAAAELLKRIADGGASDAVIARWETFTGAASAFGPGAPWNRDIEYLFEKLIGQLPALRDGTATVGIGRTKCELGPRECRLCLDLLGHIMKTELTRSLSRSQGIWQVLDQYEVVYDELARRHGRISFEDAQYMLTEANRGSRMAGLSRSPAAGDASDARLYIDYRLDSQLDHWLLDEFQDTSDLQWKVLRNLADEVLQDDSGQRTFFYVGDVKQAIYGWRGGNARLFGAVLSRYRERIEESPLDASFRSCRPVIDTVSHIFGALPDDAGLPTGACRAWEAIWKTHRCADGHVPKEGYAALVEPPCEHGQVKPDDEDRYAAAAHILQDLAPIERALSVAILVRTNDTGRAVVDYLRRQCPGLPVIHEGNASITDNPVVELLLSLVKFAHHPGDTFAWRHLQMSPLARHFADASLDRAALPVPLLQEIQTDGFQAFVRTWGARLDSLSPLDDFGKMRLADLVDAAGTFDADGSRDGNAFLQFVENYEVHELAGANAVRVMTIHQSKGLGFDAVILPDLMGRSMTGARQVDFVTSREPATNEPRWALRMPRRAVAESDEVLGNEVRATDENACFDALCVLYVALTRAKQGLYMVTSFPGKTAQALSPARFLKQQLAGEPRPVDGPSLGIGTGRYTCLYECGRRDWFAAAEEKVGATPAAPRVPLPRGFARRKSKRERLVRVAPSAQEIDLRSAARLFAGEALDVLDFGHAVHQLFQAVTWIEEADADAIIGAWVPDAEGSEDVRRDACAQFRRALQQPEAQEALARPPENPDLWRERSFEIVMDSRWVSGAFDRVVVLRDASGAPLEARLLDFKSDRVERASQFRQAVTRYAPQLALYGEALARMLGLSPAEVSLQILFTRTGRVFDVPSLPQGAPG